MPAEATVERNHSSLNSLGRREIIFAAPVLLSLLVLFTSPNFQSSRASSLRAGPATASAATFAPLGSDFLQEWTGGYIWLSQQRSELYSADHFKQIQHDPNIVGFSWSESKFYPMVYPPFYYMLVSPLALLPYQLAMSLWIVAIGLTLGLTVFVWCKYFPPAERHWGKCLIASLAFYPILMCFNTAHKSILLLLILTSTFLLLHHRRSFSAGAIFGLIAFKPHLAILIGVAMLLKRQWQFVLGAIASAGTLVALSFVAGPDLCSDYFQQCLAFGDYSTNAGYQISESHTLLSALQLTVDKASLPALYYMLAGTGVLFVIVALYWILRGTLETNSTRFRLQFSALVIATVLLSPHLYTYDLAILLLPIGLIMFALDSLRKRSTTDKRGRRERVLPMLCLALFASAGISTKLAAGLHFQLTLAVMLGLLIAIASVARTLFLSSEHFEVGGQ